jgi:phosphoserine phosphatase RsbU/P
MNGAPAAGSSGEPVVPAENAEDLYEHAPCGYLSTLPDGTVTRVNATLLSWTGYHRDDLVGKRRFVELLSPGGRIYHETHYAPLLSMQGSARELAFDMVCSDGSRLPVLINANLVRTPDGDPHVIRISIFDATDRREYERELLRARRRAEESEARARLLAQTLQSSLLPPELPAISGLDVAAGYRPAGTGGEVGGDFYDVFNTGDDDWAVVLGDVCGKGAEAATVTALARHTVRAAAMHHSKPSAVLDVLNSRLLQHPTERFCTALYLLVHRDDAGPVQVTLASGGHPLPLLCEAAGIRAVGEAGSLLGVLAEPDLVDRTIALDQGQALFCYTDGLTEGRRGEEFFGEQRVRDLLASLHRRRSEDVVRAVFDEIVAFQDGLPRDDMAAVLITVPSGQP